MTETDPIESMPPAAGRRRPWVVPVVAVVALLVGVGIGAIAGGGSVEDSEEYQALAGQLADVRSDLTAAEAERDEAQGRINDAEAEARDAKRAASQRSVDLDAREAELGDREDAVTAREAAVTTAEEQVAASTIGPGTWTVGVDIEAGTYRTAADVSSDCYWAILRTGSNGDIIDNDIPGGGRPQVSLSEGQDFQTSRCGDWIRQ